MLPVNYHHLYYFWVTAKEGSITRAREKLLLAQPTLSLQIRQLEKAFGKRLLTRGRHGVSLTPEGRVAFEYCERIFPQGEALVSAMKDGEAGSPPILRLGVARSISREIVLRVLESASPPGSGIRSTVHTGSLSDLRERLERHTLDLVVSDTDFSGSLGREFRGRLAGAIPVLLVASARLKTKLGRFPAPGQELPMLLRSPDHPVRKDVEEYLRRHRLVASVAAETEDSDLIRTLALQGKGVAALNALAVRADLRSGRLAGLHKAPTGIREHVWFVASVHPNLNKRLQAVLQELMSRFAIAV